jgi:rhamnogalacturonan hydrolase
MGSLGADTAVSDITYRNIYTWSSNQMFMIKSNGGSGSVSNVVLENFIGHGNAYSLNIDSYWSSMKPVAGSGVQLSRISISNWKGTERDGSSRGPIKVVCASGAPCHDISITDFAMWTEQGSTQSYTCQNAYGSGFCLNNKKTGPAYPAVTQWVSAAPKGYAAPTMADDLKSAFGTTLAIPVPDIPASFFPGVPPIHKLAGSK